ncbi:MAG TPA: PEP-CTERM sorting domain-containing protein [Steroidobacteraceae bacterium]|nr:PEP-CTERM sorting domain-containing protein [Steroidobacteraceae bacterium]
MKTVGKLTATAGASVAILAASSLLGASSAWAAPCAAGSVSEYTATGFSCTVGPLTFSHFSIAVSTSGTGFVTDNAVNAFQPLTSIPGEYGFSLAYAAGAGGAGSTADVQLSYEVTSAPGAMVDAYMELTGGTSGTGFATETLGETLSTGSSTVGTMSLGGPGVTTTTFAPEYTIFATKDQDDTVFTGATTAAMSSQLEDAFSVTGGGVPEPGTIALFGAALLGGSIWLRRRRG